MDAVIISMLAALLLLVLRTMATLMEFRGAAETLLKQHAERLASIELSVSDLECQKKTGHCSERRVAL